MQGSAGLTNTHCMTLQGLLGRLSMSRYLGA